MSRERSIYRWVEPETVVTDGSGKQSVVPPHQEQGEYIEEADMPGYVIVLRDGQKHLVKERDIVAILSSEEE